jgi:hypothetical protein
MDDPITSSFAPLIGLPCWGVKRGQGSILSLDFGEPHLIVREPYESKSGSPAIRARAARRLVKPVGAWYLFIVCCHWRFFSRNEEQAHDESDHETIDAAAEEIDGQKLIRVNLDVNRHVASFYFDLGGALITWPYEDDDNDEQWFLRLPGDLALGYRADGRYSFGSSELKTDEVNWLSLPSEPLVYSVGSPPSSQNG